MTEASGILRLLTGTEMNIGLLYTINADIRGLIYQQKEPIKKYNRFNLSEYVYTYVHIPQTKYRHILIYMHICIEKERIWSSNVIAKIWIEQYISFSPYLLKKKINCCSVIHISFAISTNSNYIHKHTSTHYSRSSLPNKQITSAQVFPVDFNIGTDNNDVFMINDYYLHLNCYIAKINVISMKCNYCLCCHSDIYKLSNLT